LEKNAIGTPQSGRASSAAFPFEISGFDQDQRPKRRKIALVNVIGDVG
jgi:hypothetical protein